MGRLFLVFSLFLLSHAVTVHAARTFKDGKLISSQESATMSVQYHYSAVLDAYQNQNWEEAIHQSLIVVKNFPSTPFADEALFYLGVGYFHTEELESANKCLTTYLKKHATPKYFEE